MLWRRRGRSHQERLESDESNQDARVEVLSAVEELKRSIDRLERIADKFEGGTNGRAEA